MGSLADKAGQHDSVCVWKREDESERVTGPFPPSCSTACDPVRPVAPRH